MSSIRSLQSSEYKIKNIRFEYVAQDSDLVPSHLLDVDVLPSPSTYFKTQKEFFGCIDFNTNNDSYNFLTGRRHSEHPSANDQTFVAVYTNDAPILDGYNTGINTTPSCPQPIEWNDFITSPQDAYTPQGSKYLVFDHTITIPLNNNLTETNTTIQETGYRKYITMNFGENCMDSFKPEFYFSTDSKLIEPEFKIVNGEHVFFFRIPDLSTPILINDILNWDHFGAYAGKTKETSDKIFWNDGKRNRLVWYYQNPSSGDRYWTESHDWISSHHLYEKIDYKYIRPIEKINSVVDELIEDPSNNLILFAQGELSGNVILDRTQFAHNAVIV